MHDPRVLVVLDTLMTWSRGILRGFAGTAHRHGWSVLHYHPGVDLSWLSRSWPLQAAVLGPSFRGAWPSELGDCVSVAVNADRSADGVASVFPDERRIAELAFEHLQARGFRHLTTFRFDDSPFAVAREGSFRESARRAGAELEPSWWIEAADPPRSEEHGELITGWLIRLAKPCGIFACCDAWARVVARYAREAGLRVPEDVALVGADNDEMECEIISPPLSSVAVPWRRIGEEAAELVRRGLRGKSIAGRRVLVEPIEVVTRRSSDTFAIDDPLVARAVSWIHEHAERRVTVPMVASASGVSRQRLERHFRGALGRTVMQEARRAHVELAKRLLATTDLSLPQVAKKSGFTNAALLSVAFNREIGIPPGAYRRIKSE